MPCLVLSLPRALALVGAQGKHTTFHAVKFKSVHFLNVPGHSLSLLSAARNLMAREVWLVN